MDIDVEKLENSLSLDELLENDLDVDNLVSEFESRIKKTFDSLRAPMKNKQLVVRKMQLWFTSELKNHKRIVQNREKFWRKYRVKSTG